MDEPARSEPERDEAERDHLLEEQKARIAALRVAVLTGRVPVEGEFDYERFFAAKPEPREP